MNTTKVKLRTKKISNHRLSLYLDFYPPIRGGDGKTTRREFLKMYVQENPSTPLEKENKKATLLIAEQIRSRKENELQKPEVYSESEREQLALREKRETPFIDLFQRLSKERQKTLHGSWTSSLNYYIEFINGREVKCSDINVDFINSFKSHLLTAKSLRREKMKLSRNSALSYFNKFRAVLRYAYSNGYLVKDYRSMIEGIKEEESERSFLTSDELSRLASTPFSDDVLRRACLFSALSGLRFSDIKGLCWKDINDYKSGTFLHFRHKKTNSLERHPISQEARKLLGERSQSNKPVFPNLKYSDRNNKRIQDWVTRAEIGKHITFHCFRHTYATLLLTEGVDIYTVSKMLGHKNLQTTQIYTKVIDDKKNEAANKLNFPL